MWTYARKEMLERLRTYKIIGFALIFINWGFWSPVLTWLSPYILLLIEDEALQDQLRPQLTNPTVNAAVQQYTEFFTLLPFALILLLMPTIAWDRKTGMLEYEFSQPIMRAQIYLGKFLVDAGLIFAGIILSSGLCLVFTSILLGEVYIPGFYAVNGLLLCYLLMLHMLIMCIGAKVPNMIYVAGISLLLYLLVQGIGALPTIGMYTPAGLIHAATQITVGQDPTMIHFALMSAATLSFGAFFWGLRSFIRQDL